MFELVISVITALALVGICVVLICIASSLIKMARVAKYWTVMNHLGLMNTTAQLGDFINDDARERLADTIDISRKYVKEFAPEEFED